jgi:ATP-binding cassette subfamily C protein CydCD
MRKRVDHLGSRAREAAGELGAFAIDSLQGMGEIVAFQQEQRRGAALDGLSDRHIALRKPFFRELTFQQALLEIFTGLGGLAVVVVGGVLVLDGVVDPAILPLLTILAMAAFLPVSEIAQVGRQLADTLGATRRLYALYNEPVAVTDGPGLSVPSGAVSLALRDITFQYPGQARPALRDVGVAIPAGKTVALVGPSGAGKTTAAQLLMRFWDADQGEVSMNGTDLRHYKLDELRRQIALVSQDTYLFNDTLRSNILIARPDAREDELRAAIDHAALGDLVAALPDGLDAMVGERGTSLSGGQRQRVAIARALAPRPSVLLADEPVSMLDVSFRLEILHLIDRLKREDDLAVLYITHDLATARHFASEILVMNKGSIVERGPADDVILRPAHPYTRALADAAPDPLRPRTRTR